MLAIEPLNMQINLDEYRRDRINESHPYQLMSVLLLHKIRLNRGFFDVIMRTVLKQELYNYVQTTLQT